MSRHITNALSKLWEHLWHPITTPPVPFTPGMTIPPGGIAAATVELPQWAVERIQAGAVLETHPILPPVQIGSNTFVERTELRVGGDVVAVMKLTYDREKP